MTHWRAYYNERYLKWVVWLVVSMWWIAILVEHYSRGTILWGEMVNETGQLTWYLLLFTIFISLLHKLFPSIWQINNIVPLRKYTGICCWIIGLTHAGSTMLNRGISSNPRAIIETSLSLESGMVFGAASFLIMLPLFITSTNYAVQKMGYVWWKRLHKLTHVAFVLAAAHILVLKYQDTGEIFAKTAGAMMLYIVGYTIVFWRSFQKNATHNA